MNKIKSLLSLVVVVGLAISTNFIYAQTSVIAPPGVNDQISATITPEIPGPDAPVSIFIESFSADLQKSYIVWQVNGVTRTEGAGLTTFNFVNGAIGSLTTITVSIDTSDNRFITKSFTFRPASVNLIYEGLTYTPPFYRGKALFSPQSSVKVVALPHIILESGAKANPSNLVYTWKKDGKVIQESSGFGRQSIVIDSPIITRPMTVTAEITAVGSNVKTSQTIEITPTEPEVIFYENNLLSGVQWNQSLGDRVFLNAKEIQVQAEPYYFSVPFAQTGDLRYTWGLNGSKVNLPQNQNFIGLRNELDSSGSARISLTLESGSKILQAIQKNLILEFSSQN